jgi:putative FmdB family regulatory protein
MPTYEYFCPECGLDYSEERPITAEEKELTCAAEGCGAKLSRKFATPPIVFKGTGFSSNRG